MMPDGVQFSRVDPAHWNALISGLPGAHLLQTRQWVGVKALVGWQPSYLAWRSGDRLLAAAMVLTRTLRLAGMAPLLKVMYAPKGPLLSDWSDAGVYEEALSYLVKFARDNGAIFIKIDPDVILNSAEPGQAEFVVDSRGEAVCAHLQRSGWRYSGEQIQFRNTVWVDLLPTEDDILARMKQKTRYNIRLSQRNQVSVRTGNQDDIPMLVSMYAETAARDGFVIRDEAYYRQAWGAFMAAEEGSPASEPVAEPLIAEVEGEPVAGLILYRFAGRAWYMFGMSRAKHREKMPNYLLQWEAIRRAKAAGCHTYDLWGAPELEDPQDPLAGVYRFKAGLGGRYVRMIGAWDFPLRPALYLIYTRVVPRVLELMRRKARTRIQRQVFEA